MPTYYDEYYVAPAGSYVLEMVGKGQPWKRVFRSFTRFLDAARVEKSRLADGERLKGYHVIGSGPDGYTESIRI